MFFNPKMYVKTKHTSLRFDASTVIVVEDGIQPNVFQAGIKRIFTDSDAPLCKKITFAIGIPEDQLMRPKVLGIHTDNAEEYAISLDEEESYVWAWNYNGLLYGLATIEQMWVDGNLGKLFLYDFPLCPIRGYRVFLPGRDAIDQFKKTIDMLAYYKFNAIILEIGGAMEYKRHPEINKAWVDFCSDVRRYSGRAHEIQNQTYPWAKNSSHCDNGDGGFLTQEECADIAAYCRSHGIEVIPEEPTLSHTDYICLAHPEIREQEGDRHPDTYCPSNPASYQLVFDLLDEVIDVFKPNYINIGHDEAYSVGVCPRCRDKSPVDLYVEDITKIHDYLADRGVKTIMWGEKLLDARYPNGEPIGGAETRVTDEETGESRVYIPALYPCAQKLPKDIVMLGWYWEFDPEYDKVYHDNGYTLVYGNLSVSHFERWKERIEWGAKGGFVSNWGSNADEYMQRNNQTFELVYAAYAFWCWDFKDDEETREDVCEVVARECYRRRHENMEKVIIVAHTTDHYIPHEPFYDGIFITDEKYKLGDYEIIYSDDSRALVPVVYGTHITNRDIPLTVRNRDFTETFCSTMPHNIGGKLYCECGYEDPHPEKTPVGIRYFPLPGKEDIQVIIQGVKLR